jgi:eukaryotic-like serine/threonine-protein kinase
MRADRHSLQTIHVGEYVLEQVLGVGGMAEVFVARREGAHGFSKRVALKRILPQLAGDPRLVAMFCDEARIQAELAHPNLVQVFDFGEHDGQPFMAMELVDGLSGSQLIARIAARRSTVDLGVALHIAREVLEALAYVHSARDAEGRPLGVVHRDVAPSNILLGRMGQVKLGDFGIVRAHAIAARTVPGELKGKVGYVSPEQALGMPLDGRSDLFSLAIVLAELLICKPLFTGNNELEILEALHRGNLRTLEQEGRHIPDDLKAVLKKALSRWPEQRFQSAEEFAAALDLVARRHRQVLGAHVLSSWLEDQGLVALQSDVREKLAPSPPGIPLPPPSPRTANRISDYPFSEHVTLAPNEVESIPPGSIADALSQFRPVNDAPPELAHAVSAPRGATQGEVSYRLRQAHGTIIGPLGLARLLELCAVGRLGSDVQVSRNGGPFLPVTSVFELSRLAARPAYRFHEPIALRAKERFGIAPETLPEIVFALVRGRRSGLLVAAQGPRQVRVYFDHGTPTFTSSTDARELVGSRLVAAGALGKAQLERCLELGWRRGLRLGDALVEAKLVSAGDVLRVVSEQPWRRLGLLFSLRSGELAFAEGAVHGEDDVPVGSRFEIVARALLEAYGDDEIGRMLGRVEAGGTLGPARDADSVARALALPSAEAAALRSALRGRSFSALRHEARSSWHFDAASLRRAVFVGLASGVLIYAP